MCTLTFMIEIVTASILIMVASLAGKFTVWKRGGNLVENNLDFFVSFSAGVFAIIVYRLATETIEHSESVTTGLAWILGGAIVVWTLSKLLPSLHRHTDGKEINTVGPIDVRRVLLSDGVHNIGDGILLAASFAVSPAVGVLTTISVFVHELIQEISEFFVLREAGYTSRQALKLNFIVSGTILIGSVGGFFLLESFEALEAPLLGVAAGMLLVVVFHDLIPHSVRSSVDLKHHIAHIVWFAIGALLMFGVTAFVPHEYEHEADDTTVHVPLATDVTSGDMKTVYDVHYAGTT
ncbi:ZIP family metal transporter [Acetobacteraceae bacterium]|nr:ZIP family metal transporter [Candidatus Parcubacteria bacterium]